MSDKKFKIKNIVLNRGDKIDKQPKLTQISNFKLQYNSFKTVLGPVKNSVLRGKNGIIQENQYVPKNIL